MSNIVLTGASRGIGLGTMKELADQGNNIWACVRTINEDWLHLVEQLESKNNIWIKPILLDLESPETIKAAARQIVQGGGYTVDALINNAGISGTWTFMMTSPEVLAKVFQVDFFGLVLLSQFIVKKMIRQKKGNIINIVSVRGLKPEAGNIAYGTAKCAVIYATKVMAEELKPYGIRVNAIAPGAIQTDMLSYKDKTVMDQLLAQSALRRIGTVKDVVDIIKYLVDDRSSYITGEILPVNGGYFD